MVAPAVFAFGLVAFGFLGMGPVTIAVDSYGPVTDNAQSVFELSHDRADAGRRRPRSSSEYGFAVNFEKAKHFLEENDGAGNTFKATAKPVLIGTAVVGATTMIFSIIVALTNGLTTNIDKLSILHPPFLLGLITGGAIIYWFTGASMQAVTTGAYRAVEFIKANMNLESTAAASVEDSKKVVEICTKYAQAGMFNIFLTVFFATLAFAFVEPFFFIGYLISIALFGLYQAIFMANAGGAWDNAKKIVEVELKQKGTPLHAATVVGDTVGDPFKDTSSVALNPIIKFTTLFGLLAVELAVSLTEQRGPALSHMLAAVFFVVSMVFVYRSFYGMRIESVVWFVSVPVSRRLAAETPLPSHMPESLFSRKPIAELISEGDNPNALKRALGAGDLIMLAIGAVIGAGIFGSIGSAAAGQIGPNGEIIRVGAGPALVLSFLLLGACCALAGLCYAELASMIPQAGSAYAYSYATLGEFVAWIIGWDLILEYAVGNVAVAISWGDYFKSLVGDWIHDARLVDDGLSDRAAQLRSQDARSARQRAAHRRHSDPDQRAGVRDRHVDHLAAAARRSRERARQQHHGRREAASCSRCSS